MNTIKCECGRWITGGGREQLEHREGKFHRDVVAGRRPMPTPPDTIPLPPRSSRPSVPMAATVVNSTASDAPDEVAEQRSMLKDAKIDYRTKIKLVYLPVADKRGRTTRRFKALFVPIRRPEKAEADRTLADAQRLERAARRREHRELNRVLKADYARHLASLRDKDPRVDRLIPSRRDRQRAAKVR